ncbi:enoyl-CoA hydratase/isomerase family protein [Azospirillum sp. B510]|uniref:enoyl-CoA hydratase/isomerase family protein n=1 Tax=Azospirillum sp. (strain B510) TaxID=137722 RepID=UPI0011D0F418|nr:enoyl-CoA hydratase/isomerase family protein [Azospirillum sp. B510]
MADRIDVSIDDLVPLRRDGAVCVLTMTYPERRNAFSSAMRRALLDRFDHLMHNDPECRAIVLTGAAGSFCAGGDLSEMKERPVILARQVFEVPRDLVRTMVCGPKPIVAAVEGVAFGAGLSLVCACDHVVAATDGRFCAAFLKVGLLPDTGILWTLPRRVGFAKARELMLFASEIDGMAAQELGLADLAVPPGAAVSEALKVAHAFAALPAAAVACLKNALGEAGDSPDEAMRVEIDHRAALHCLAPVSAKERS